MTTATIALGLFAAFLPNAVVPLGNFENFEYTEEHQYGYGLYLWRHGDALYGIWRAANGLAGDPPTGVLEEGEYNAGKRKMSFSAKLIVGLHSCRVHSELPARTIHAFQGKLTRDRLTGTLKIIDVLHPERLAQAESVTLKSVRGGWEMGTYGSRAEWESEMLGVFRVATPVWE